MKKKYRYEFNNLPVYLQIYARKEYWYERGIYAAFDPHTGYLLYIGKTTACFIHRWSSHIRDLEYGKHCNEMLQWKFLNGDPIETETEDGEKYYEEYHFRFKAIHICTNNATDDEISRLEEYYINVLNPMYNRIRKKLSQAELDKIEEELIV